MSLYVYVRCSVYNPVDSVYGLLGFWAARVRWKPGPRLVGVTLFGIPTTKSGIAGEAGGVCTQNQFELKSIV